MCTRLAILGQEVNLTCLIYLVSVHLDSTFEWLHFDNSRPPQADQYGADTIDQLILKELPGLVGFHQESAISDRGRPPSFTNEVFWIEKTCIATLLLERGTFLSRVQTAI